MQNLKAVFTRMNASKKERKQIKSVIEEGLKQSKPWVDVTEEIRQKKQKRTLITNEILSHYPSEVKRLEELNLSIATDQQMVTDIAMTMMMKGETIELESGEAKWEPKFTVKFRQLSLL